MSVEAQQKTCFVTVGATASFSRLISTVLSVDFSKALELQQYTNLVVQYGQDGEGLYQHCLELVRSAGASSLHISGFDIDEAGLGQYMRRAKGGGDNKGAAEGVVISHAGTSLASPV